MEMHCLDSLTRSVQPTLPVCPITALAGNHMTWWHPRTPGAKGQHPTPVLTCRQLQLLGLQQDGVRHLLPHLLPHLSAWRY